MTADDCIMHSAAVIALCVLLVAARCSETGMQAFPRGLLYTLHYLRVRMEHLGTLGTGSAAAAATTTSSNNTSSSHTTNGAVGGGNAAATSSSGACCAWQRYMCVCDTKGSSVLQLTVGHLR